jgi:hypothetical protein
MVHSYHLKGLWAAGRHCAAVAVQITALILVGCGNSRQPDAVAVDIEQALICRSPRWDFGIADPANTQRLDHEFSLENVSDKSVRIDKVTATCGCIVFEPPPAEVASGEVLKLPVGVQVAGRPGAFSKSVVVHLGTTPPTSVNLQISGQLSGTSAMYSAPIAIDFGDIAQNETKHRTIKLARYDASSIVVRNVNSESSAIRVEVCGPNSTTTLVELTATLNGSVLETGSFDTAIRIISTRQDDPEIQLPVKANVTPVPSGLVSAIVVTRLTAGTFQDRPLVSVSQNAPSIEDITYEGDSSVTLELIQATTNSTPSRPTVRVRPAGELVRSRLCHGILSVSLEGRPKPIAIPVTVVLVK